MENDNEKKGKYFINLERKRNTWESNESRQGGDVCVTSCCTLTGRNVGEAPYLFPNSPQIHNQDRTIHTRAQERGRQREEVENDSVCLGS